MTRRTGLLTLGLLVAACCSVLLVAQTPPPGMGPEQFTGAAKEWPVVGGDWSNRRYSALTQITPANVTQLRGAWVSDTFVDGATSRAMPVVRDGLMFVTTQTRIYALDAKTGRTVWIRDPARNTKLGAPEPGYAGELAVTIAVMKNGQIIPSAQGVGVAQGLVFVGLWGGEVVALREKTGELVWRSQVGDDPAPMGQGVSAAVTYAAGMIFVGTSNGDFGNRTRMAALDAATGRKLWQFFVVPGPGERGHETWAQDNEVWKVGGGGIWRTAAIDPELGLVYFGTGNAFPPYGGEMRPGDNLYISSVVAVEMKTGKYRWHQQLIHHDMWEGDVRQPVILFDAIFGGRMRKALAAMRTDGYFFLYDRATGAPLIPIEERPVPQSSAVKSSPTQPFPVGVKRMLPDCSAWDGEVPKEWRAVSHVDFSCREFVPPSPTTGLPQYVSPGGGGGTGSMSYSPQTGYLYVFASGGGFEWKTQRPKDPFFFGPGTSVQIPGRRRADSVSVLAAIDSHSGAVVWTKPTPTNGPGFGGSLVTATGLLIYPVPQDGTLQVRDAKTGDSLFALPTGGAANGGGAPTTYEIDGEQYVAVAWGPQVRAFKLGGSVPVPTAAPTRPTTTRREGADSAGFSGPVQASDVITTATLMQDLGNDGGTRYDIDQYAFKPYRTRVKVGRVVWGNNGSVGIHTIVALDGSWTTGPIQPGKTIAVLFTKPGAYGYYCKEHPWSYGEVIVEEDTSASAGEVAFPDAQVARGQAQYNQHCSQCHGGNLAGVGASPALSGGAFLDRWGRGTLGDLFTHVRTTMPQQRPGSLADETYLDILTFVMRSNNVQGSSAELKVQSDALKKPIESTGK
jgi:alcohol dehydrogenase (cytochrome c)